MPIFGRIYHKIFRHFIVIKNARDWVLQVLEVGDVLGDKILVQLQNILIY